MRRPPKETVGGPPSGAGSAGRRLAVVIAVLGVLLTECHAGPVQQLQQRTLQETLQQVETPGVQQQQQPPQQVAVPGVQLSQLQQLPPVSCRHKGRRYEAGERWATSGAQGCAEYECGEDGAVTTTWCGHFLAGPGCRAVRGDTHALYPACCPTLRCGRPE